MAYPSIISVISNPQATDRLNNPSHSTIHQNENTAITEIETFVGTLSSAVGTLVYDIRSANSGGGGHVQAAALGGTGQTTFNKGDLLVASSSSVVTKLAVGADAQALVADAASPTGVKWSNALGSNIQSFVSTGTWSKPSNLGLNSQVFVQLWGGGGSGGASNDFRPASGGGGGYYQYGFFSASVLGTTELVIVGAGGSSVAGLNVVGITGGNTVFGSLSSLLTGYGGGPGNSTGANSGGGGAGGIFGPGVGPSGSNGGVAGSNGVSSLFSSGGGGYLVGSQDALVATGGGGGAAQNAGNTIYGGAGGGGALPGGGAGTGGISQLGGNGGAGNVSVAGIAGGLKGGGGGGSSGSSTAKSGAGGGGYAVITAIP